MAISYRENEATYQFTSGDYNTLTTFLSYHGRVWMSFVLVVSDSLSFLFAWYLALYLRGSLIGNFDPTIYSRFAPLIFVFIAVFLWRQLYPAIGLGEVEELRRLLVNISLVFLAIAAFSFIDQIPHI